MMMFQNYQSAGFNLRNLRKLKICMCQKEVHLVYVYDQNEAHFLPKLKFKSAVLKSVACTQNGL